jgi:hypothetical protein
MQVKGFDTINGEIFVDRGCFGTQPESWGTSHRYVYSNRQTIDGVQIQTTKGKCKIGGWSSYAGNHLGGNSYYLHQADSISERFANGYIVPADSSVEFKASDKTVTFSASTSLLSFKEGDNIIFYFGQNFNSPSSTSLNNGLQAKILKNKNNILHLDTTPIDELVDTSDYRTFEEASDWDQYSPDGADPTVDDDGSPSYLEITGTSAVEKQGAELSTSYFSTIHPYRTYKVEIRAWTSGDDLTSYIELGGTIIPFTMDDDNALKTFYMTVKADSNLRVYNIANYTSTWYIDAVSIIEIPTIYIESNLLKNHTFHHATDTSKYPIGTNRENKINSWTHIAYEDVATGSDTNTCANLYGLLQEEGIGRLRLII